MLRRSTFGDVCWYGFEIGQYSSVTAGPDAIATRCTSCRKRGNLHSPCHFTPDLPPSDTILASRILRPLAKSSILSALAQSGPSTRTATLPSPEDGTRSPGPYLPLTVISASKPQLTITRPWRRLSTASAVSISLALLPTPLRGRGDEETALTRT